MTVSGCTNLRQRRHRAIGIPDPYSPEALGIGDSFKVVAGARCEVQQTDRAREIEVIPLRFAREGTGLVLVGVG
jgi:hypothetical protein